MPITIFPSMKRINSKLLYPLLLISIAACHSNTIPYTQDGDWVAKSQLNGPARSEAVSFVINDTAYLGTGWDGLNIRYSDFWKYDQANDVWGQLAVMPDSGGRSSAVGFATDGKGYIGTGYDGFLYLKDFWQYDPVLDTFYRKADFPGGERYEAVAFGLGDFGYVGTGFNGANALKDFYRYDPASDSWKDIGFSGNKRYGAVTWTYNNKAYLVTGVNSGTQVNDFWVFDPAAATGNWSELRRITNYSTDSYDDSYTSIVRDNAAAFTVGAFAYLSTGENGVSLTTTWEYDITTDLWKQKSNFEGPATTGACGFTVANRGFVATGRSSAGTTGASDQLREFLPNAVLNANNN